MLICLKTTLPTALAAILVNRVAYNKLRIALFEQADTLRIGLFVAIYG
jgi:hypothetical protein